MEAKVSLVELGLTWQFPGENLDLYAKRFHEKALGCYDASGEKTMVDVVGTYGQ